MKKTLLSFALALACAGAAGAADRKGCKGDSLFTRMPDTFVKDCLESEFDAQPFHCAPGRPQNLEGRYLMTRYEAKPGAQAATALQVLRNHDAAAAELGAKKLFSDKRYACYSLARDGKELTAEVDAAWNRGYVVRVVEKAAMKQEVAGNSDIFLKSIRDTGHVAVYGIYFDTGKADLKPSSEPALKEILALLEADPALKIYVVGHTDNVGTLGANTALSQARAAAVVKELTARGIDGARLKPAGVASLVPVASNRAETGRAKNRRVELVEQ